MKQEGGEYKFIHCPAAHHPLLAFLSIQGGEVNTPSPPFQSNAIWNFKHLCWEFKMFLISSLCYRESNSGPQTDLSGKENNHLDRCFKPIICKPAGLWIWAASMVWTLLCLMNQRNSIYPSKPRSLDASHLSPLVGAGTIPKNRASPSKVPQ